MTPSEAGALAIHCSDPRYQAAFHEFLQQELNLERYALLAVPGGPQFLTLAEYLPKFSWAGWRWVKFLGKLGSTNRIILIAHEDCRWYQDMGFSTGPLDLRARQEHDLRQVTSALRGRFDGCRVETYYARMHKGRPHIEPLC